MKRSSSYNIRNDYDVAFGSLNVVVLLTIFDAIFISQVNKTALACNVIAMDTFVTQKHKISFLTKNTMQYCKVVKYANYIGTKILIFASKVGVNWVVKALVLASGHGHTKPTRNCTNKLTIGLLC